MKLRENFQMPQTARFCKTAIMQLKITIPAKNRTKNRAKPHHRKPLRPFQRTRIRRILMLFKTDEVS